MFKYLLVGVLLVGLHPTNAQGEEAFERADQLFENRGFGFGQIAAAKAAYWRVLNSGEISNEQLAYGVSQIAKLSFYEGTYVAAQSDPARQLRIWDDCLLALARLEPFRTTFADSYYYHYLTCQMGWYQHANFGQRLQQVATINEKLLEILDEDLELRPLGFDSRFEGGGINRALANLYYQPYASDFNESLPDLRLASELIDRSLGARPMPGLVNWGLDYYINTRISAQIFMAMDRPEEAADLIADGIDDIEARWDDDDLPSGLGPETRAELELLRSLL